jgi:hypothetical protein
VRKEGRGGGNGYPEFYRKKEIKESPFIKDFELGANNEVTGVTAIWCCS